MILTDNPFDFPESTYGSIESHLNHLTPPVISLLIGR